MPEQIGSNPIAEKEIPSSNYIQIGNVPETGKHQHIKELNSLGLNVPPTLVCDYQSLGTDDVKNWLENQFKENDLQIRTTTADENRNSPSMRDPSGTFEEFLQVLHDFSIENPVLTFILQGTPKNSINKDILSGNMYRKGNQIVADLWPDLASWGNRMNKSPLWKYTVLSDGGRDIQKITTGEVASKFWNDILYRRGRMFVKDDKVGKVPPKIEDASLEELYYKETIEYAKKKLKEGTYPNDAVKYYFDEIKNGKNILEMFPDEKISALDRDMRMLLENPNFSEKSVAKFSLLLGDETNTIYWDLIPQHWR